MYHFLTESYRFTTLAQINENNKNRTKQNRKNQFIWSSFSQLKQITVEIATCVLQKPLLFFRLSFLKIQIYLFFSQLFQNFKKVQERIGDVTVSASRTRIAPNGEVTLRPQVSSGSQVTWMFRIEPESPDWTLTSNPRYSKN